MLFTQKLPLFLSLALAACAVDADDSTSSDAQNITGSVSEEKELAASQEEIDERLNIARAYAEAEVDDFQAGSSNDVQSDTRRVLDCYAEIGTDASFYVWDSNTVASIGFFQLHVIDADHVISREIYILNREGTLKHRGSVVDGAIEWHVGTPKFECDDVHYDFGI